MFVAVALFGFSQPHFCHSLELEGFCFAFKRQANLAVTGIVETFLFVCPLPLPNLMQVVVLTRSRTCCSLEARYTGVCCILCSLSP